MHHWLERALLDDREGPSDCGEGGHRGGRGSVGEGHTLCKEITAVTLKAIFRDASK